MRIRSILLALVLSVAGLAACGGGFEGTYADEMGVVSYTFKSDGTVTVTGPFGSEVEMEYEKDGDRVLVGSGGARQVLDILEDGSLDMGITTLRKQEE